MRTLAQLLELALPYYEAEGAKEEPYAPYMCHIMKDLCDKHELITQEEYLLFRDFIRKELAGHYSLSGYLATYGREGNTFEDRLWWYRALLAKLKYNNL